MQTRQRYLELAVQQIEAAFDCPIEQATFMTQVAIACLLMARELRTDKDTELLRRLHGRFATEGTVETV